MRTMRAGSHRRILQDMKRHHELMEKYQAEGLSREEASKKAFAEVTSPEYQKMALDHAITENVIRPVPPVSRQEREDSKYEIWLMEGGPAADEAKHRAMAEASLRDHLSALGFRVLERVMLHEVGADFDILEAVVRRGEKVNVIRWNTFNKDWMVRDPTGGWSMFKPTEAGS